MSSQIKTLLITTAIKPEYHAARESLSLREIQSGESTKKIGSYKVTLLCLGVKENSSVTLNNWLKTNSVDYIIECGSCASKPGSGKYLDIVCSEKVTLQGKLTLKSNIKNALFSELILKYGKNCIDTVATPYYSDSRKEYKADFFCMESWYLFKESITAEIPIISLRVVTDNGESNLNKLFKKRIREASIKLFSELLTFLEY